MDFILELIASNPTVMITILTMSLTLPFAVVYYVASRPSARSKHETSQAVAPQDPAVVADESPRQSRAA